MLDFWLYPQFKNVYAVIASPFSGAYHHLLSFNCLSQSYLLIEYDFHFSESPEKSPKSRHGGRGGSTSNKSKPELPKEAREASNEFAVFLKVI